MHQLGDAAPAGRQSVSCCIFAGCNQYVPAKLSLPTCACRATRIVAVVGAGHLPGIKEAWEVEIDAETLTQLPPPSLMSRIPWGKVSLVIAGSGIAVAVVIYGRRRMASTYA